jgi:hypothetical protein
MAHPGPYATLAAPSGSGESGEATPVAPPSVDVAERPLSGERSAGPHPPIATEPFVASEPPPTGDAS